MEYKVGGKVRLVTDGGFDGVARAGMVGTVVRHGALIHVDCAWIDGRARPSGLAFYDSEIEPYADPTVTYKVGDKVRIIANTHGHIFEIGEVVEINEHRLTSMGYTYYMALDGNTNWALDSSEIEPYTDPQPTPSSADAFANIITELRDAINAALDDGDYEAAIKYAYQWQRIEHLTPKPTT